MRTAVMVTSKHWRGADLKGVPPVVLSISDVTEELFTRNGKPETICFLWFQEHLKGLKLNATRVAVLELAYGPESDLWVGKRVRLSYDPTVKMAGQLVGGVKLQTPPGVVYTGPAVLPGWGTPAAPPGAPPPPVWNGREWVTQLPTPSALPPGVPPPPVWNAATGQWDVVNPATGEVAPPAAAPAYQRPATISERVNGSHPPVQDNWGPLPPQNQGQGQPEFDDDIPF
jgi:hypothetical protein